MILLDTHALWWFAKGDEHLGGVARERIEAALQTGEARASTISIWEIGMLLSRQRIALSIAPDKWLDDYIAQGLMLIDADRSIALDAGMMPREIHGDPCDRIIMATARSLDCPLVTSDRLLLEYGKEGWLRTIDARH